MIGRLIAPIVLLLGLTAGNAGRSAALTVSSYNITPLSGGPGTVVHLTGLELYDKNPLTVWLVISLDTAGPGGTITKFEPITKLGMTRPDPIAGQPQATVVIPGRMPDGSPITEHQLGIMLTDMNNGQIPEIGIKSFAFVPAPLPVTGQRTDSAWLLGLGACACLILGLLSRRFKRGQS